MHIWILKYGQKGFSDNFLNEAGNVVEQINQLKSRVVDQKQLGNFHFISFYTKIENSQKRYIEFDENTIRGYSGLLLGKTNTDVDFRDIKNVFIQDVEKFSGQFSIFNCSSDSFECVADNFGFHKVYHFNNGEDIYISNSLEVLKATGLLKPDRKQMLLEMMTSRFGIHPGYNTLYENVYMLPEYGRIAIKNGQLVTDEYKSINSLLNPQSDFETQLVKVIAEYKINAAYLRKYHHTVVPLSGGFDGRLVLSFFYNSEGLPLETMTYNRAGKFLDFFIAGMLSRKFKVPHTKIHIPIELKDFPIEIPDFLSPKSDPFNFVFKNAIKDFYKSEDSFKVSLGGNGGDTDWEFGEKHLKNVDKSNFKSFIKSYSELITRHPLVSEELSIEMKEKVEKYFLTKYSVFENKPNFRQLLASSMFHLERFRGRQGSTYSQESNKFFDVFAPFASESFNQLIFLSNRDQLQRDLKVSINYRIYDAMTNGLSPWAPILTAKNEFGKNLFQKGVNYIFPYLPKIEWKLRNGDTNTRIRRSFAAKINELSKDYLLQSNDEELFQLIKMSEIKEKLSNDVYKGQYNTIASILKFIENNSPKK